MASTNKPLTEQEQKRMSRLETEAQILAARNTSLEHQIKIIQDEIDGNNEHLRELNKEYAPLLRRWEP